MHQSCKKTGPGPVFEVGRDRENVEDPPKVLYKRAVNIAHIIDTETFKDLLLEMASNQFLDKNVLVFGCEKKDDKWILLQDGLTDYLQ
ncbi:36694_t:CDS:2, partial [Racocetra persica]